MRTTTVIRGIPCVLALLLVLAGKARSDEQCVCQGSVTLGRVEHVAVQDLDMKMKARIDTGAGVSSLDANIVEIKTDLLVGGETVTFQVKDKKGHSKSIERNIVKWAEIKGKGSERMLRRPVVILNLCLGGKRLAGRFNLADRSGFLYPVLIGRNVLKAGGFLIDPRKTFMEKPGC